MNEYERSNFIHELLDKWHESLYVTESLSDWLGVTVEQYGDWVDGEIGDYEFYSMITKNKR